MDLNSENETPCICDRLERWKDTNIIDLKISEIEELLKFDCSRAIHRTELELHRIRQFAGQVGVVIPHHYWEILRRVLIVRFGWPYLECSDCENSSQSFITGVVALAFLNPGRSDGLLVCDTETGWVNQVAAYLLDENSNFGKTARETACNFVSEIFVAMESGETYKRPVFKAEFGHPRLSGGPSFRYIIELPDRKMKRLRRELGNSAIGTVGCNSIGPVPSHCVSAGELYSQNVGSEPIEIKLKIPQEVAGSSHLRSLRELSLRRVVASVSKGETWEAREFSRNFREELATLIERLSTSQDTHSFFQALWQLRQLLEGYLESVTSCALPGWLVIHIHVLMRCLVETKCWHSLKTVDILLQHTNLLPTALKNLQPGTFFRRFVDGNKDFDVVKMMIQYSARLFSDSKVLRSLIMSSTGPCPFASEFVANEFALRLRKVFFQLKWCYFTRKFSPDVLVSLRGILNDIGDNFSPSDRLDTFHTNAVKILQSSCNKVCQELCARWSKSFGFRWIPLDRSILDGEVKRLEASSPSEETNSSLIHFFVARLFEDLGTMEMFAEHIGKVNDFAVSFANARLLHNRDLYVRRCLSQVLYEDVDFDCLLQDIDLFDVC